MRKNIFCAGIVGSLLLAGVLNCQAADWLVNKADPQNASIEVNYYDADSVKVAGKTLTWSEKFVLTEFGRKYYTKHLAQYPACQKNILSKGEVSYHQIDFEIKEGNFRTVAKRNYNKSNELLCTDKDMGTEFDLKWHDIQFKSPMYERYYLLVTKFKLGNI